MKRSTLTAVLLAGLVSSAGCSEASPGSAAPAAVPTLTSTAASSTVMAPSTAAVPPSTTTASTVTIPRGTAVRTTTPPATPPATPGRSSAEISLPPNLCAGTDRAQDTADAYMGALSAGQLEQALACVYPGSVPTAVTASLLAHQRQAAVYLPVESSSGPTFTYAGNGTTVLVTVTREADGKTWISSVQVR